MSHILVTSLTIYIALFSNKYPFLVYLSTFLWIISFTSYSYSLPHISIWTSDISWALQSHVASGYIMDSMDPDWVFWDQGFYSVLHTVRHSGNCSWISYHHACLKITRGFSLPQTLPWVQKSGKRWGEEENI